MYRSPKENCYTHRFFQDISMDFSYTLGANTERKHFFTFEPKECEAARLFEAGSIYSYDIEDAISRAAHSLVVYGKAFIYLMPKHTIPEKKDPSNRRLISSLNMYEVKGIVLKRYHNKLVFYCKGFDSTTEILEMTKGELIILRLNDLGYRNNYFRRIARKLGKVDVTASSSMLTKNVPGYDFSVHLKKQKLYQLKLTKDVGWFSGTDGLSDSYILYKRMLMNKLKMKLLDYIVGKINDGITTYFKRDNLGKLVAHTKELNYDRLWDYFSSGKITVTELSNHL